MSVWSVAVHLQESARVALGKLTMTKESQGFTPAMNLDLAWRFTEAAGELGVGSNFEPLAALALSGIPDGGTISQPTRARMPIGGETPAERAARVDAGLAQISPTAARVLAAWYTPGRYNVNARATYTDDDYRKGDRRREHTDPRISMLLPIERELKEHTGVALLLAKDPAKLRETATRCQGKKGTARATARDTVDAARRRAVLAVRDAQAAYASVAKRPGRRATAKRRLDAFRATLDG